MDLYGYDEGNNVTRFVLKFPLGDTIGIFC